MITYKDLTSARQRGYFAVINNKKQTITEDWAEDALQLKDIDYWNRNGFSLFFAPTFIQAVDEWRLEDTKRQLSLEKINNGYVYNDHLMDVKTQEEFDAFWFQKSKEEEYEFNFI